MAKYRADEKVIVDANCDTTWQHALIADRDDHAQTCLVVYRDGSREWIPWVRLTQGWR